LHHRSLPSFPTRRSSDLLWHCHRRFQKTSSRAIDPDGNGATVLAGGAEVLIGHPHCATIADRERRSSYKRRTNLQPRKSARMFLDRKSTRLNSSHLVISY